MFFSNRSWGAFVEICWVSHVSTSKSRGLCRDWRGWVRNDWPPRAAWPFQKSQGFVTSQRLKVKLHDSGRRIRFVLLLSGFGTRYSQQSRFLRRFHSIANAEGVKNQSGPAADRAELGACIKFGGRLLCKCSVKGSDRLVLDTLTVDVKKCPATMCHGISCYYDLLYVYSCVEWASLGAHVSICWRVWLHQRFFFSFKGWGKNGIGVLLIPPTIFFVTLRLRWSTLGSFISGGRIGRFRTCRKLSLRKKWEEKGRRRITYKWRVPLHT